MKEAVDRLKDRNTTTVVLVGEAGVGKTWTAREISKEILTEHVRSRDPEKNSFGGTLWLSLNKKYDDHDHMIRSLNEDLARQLSVLPSTEGGFEDDDSESNEGGGGGGKEEEEEKKKKKVLKENIEEKLKEMITGEKTSRYVLLTLDCAPENMDTNKILSEVECLKNLMSKEKRHLLKVLVTRRGSDIAQARSDDHGHHEFLIEPLKKTEFLTLLGKSAKTKGSENNEETIKKLFDEANIFKDAGDELRLPASVAVLVGKVFKYYNIVENDGTTTTSIVPLKKALKKAAECKEAEEMRASLVGSVYDLLPSKDEALIKCCWHSKKFFFSINNATVHYNELIAHWIMEDYLDCFNSVEKAYEEGYRVMKQLVDRSLLKVEDGDFITMEEVAFKVPDLRRLGFDETAMLGLPDALSGGGGGGDKDWQGGLGRITVADGMIKTMCGRNKWRMVSTLFIHGNRLCREVPETFFKPMKELQTLVLINPRLKSLKLFRDCPLSKLRILVLRGCDVLESDVDSIKELNLLTVLEISGAKSLKDLPGDLFENMSQLRNLNLSRIQVKYLPKTFSNLTQLRWLILRGCSCLAEIPNLKAFTELQVLDMAGVSSLTVFRDKNFGPLKSLRVLDFSQAKIAPLPFFHNLHGLTRLTLKGCTEITRVPKLDQLSILQVLELPGAEKLREFYEPSLQNKTALRILDLSRTQISRLPSSFNKLPSLEELDLSHMSSLEDMSNVSFSQLRCLQSLNLSNTRLKALPSLSNLSNLRQLLLIDCPVLEKLPEMEGLTSLEILDMSRAFELKEIPDHLSKSLKLRQLLLPDCKKLEKLPSLNELTKLEDLNLSGCKVLKEVGDQSVFAGMTLLQKLNLSETPIESLPDLSNLGNLTQLLLENCTKLNRLPPLNELSKLEEFNLCGANQSQQQPEAKSLKHMSKLHTLNLSGTSIVLLSDFTDCTNLKKLSLSSCLFLDTKPQLEKLTLLEVLNLSDTAVVPQSLLQNPSNLGELKSKNRLSLDELPIEKLLQLTNLDLWGMQVKKFPYLISNLINLKKLRLPNLTGIQQLEWNKIKRLPDDLNWEECGFFNIPGTLDTVSMPRPSISVNGTKIFKFLKENSKIWDKCFEKFRIFVCPSTKNGKDEDIYRQRDDRFFQDIYFKTICCPETSKKFLEIRGYKKCPDDLEDALKKVDCLSFIEDDFLTSVADIGVDNMEALTGLWLERCPNTVSIFSEEKAIKVGGNFNLLWLSNLPILKSLYNNKVQDQCFKNLTELYLDCCPILEYVFSSPQLPEKLEKLQVKFCDKLKTLFKCKSSEDHKLQNLHELHLLELPELTTVGVKLPGLQNAKVKGCPKLEKYSFIESLGMNKKVQITDVKEDWETGSPTVTPEYCPEGPKK
ncbi:NB-ARC domain containing protein [Trema orientale]|uniref:NB-ARC domain containing protein n=1 Tax=Trema orientale TaxID=63057 RepID=A0A2P5CVK5_TREOI|nr:NB-ARC domain containing protein [Trema orientale]